MFNSKKGEKMNKNESGRTAVEILGVLAIAGILSVAGLWMYQLFMRQQTVNSVVHALAMESVKINAVMQERDFESKEELDEYFSNYKTQISGYELTYHSSPDGDGFVSEIKNADGTPIQGKVCREFITKMAQPQFVSDVDFTVNDVEQDDGSVGSMTVRLNGRFVDFDAVCGG